MQWIDTHAHVFVKEFSADLNLVLASAKAKGISHILMPNIDEHTVEPMLQLAKDHSGFCFPMLGLHPGSVENGYQHFLNQMPAMLERNTYCAIGEIGLDLYWRKDNLAEQLDAFEQQVLLAVKYDLPVAIHSRDAFYECIRSLKKIKNTLSAGKRLRGVFHCFTGSFEEANEAMKLGFYLGIGGVLTYKTSKLPELIERIGLDKIILETDSPYLPPVPYRGKRNEPAFLREVAQKMSETLNMDLALVAEITTRNAMELFSLEK
jgi:TatD DNase family protein